MASIVNHRDIEMKFHEQLYGNILLLTNLYPTTDEFKSVFKPQMFITNNKKGFQQVIYYFLEIINPNIIKQKITSWPAYDRKLEDKFRSEVLKYILELKTEYSDFNLPMITASHLISPGGIIFVKFMFKLSQLVLYIVLKKSGQTDVLTPVKYTKNPQELSRLTMKNLRRKIETVEADIEKEVELFKEFQEDCCRKAQKISNNIARKNQEIAEYKKIYSNKCANSGIKDYESTIGDLNKKLDLLSQNLNYIRKLNDLTKECNNKLSFILDRCVLEYKKGDLKVPECISNLINPNEENLDLIKFFTGINSLLREKRLDFAYFPVHQIINMNKTIEVLLNEYTIIHRRITDATTELNKITYVNFEA